MKHFARALVAAALMTSALAFAQSPKPPDSKKGKPMSTNANIHIFNPPGMHTPNGYSHVAEITGGKLVYIAGQVSIDPAGNLVGKDDFAAQVAQVFTNLKTALEAAGGSFQNVVKLNYFCADSVDPNVMPVVRETRDRFVNTANPPASTFVVVRRLVRPEWLIEIEAVAVISK